MQMILASANPHKFEEMKAITAPFGIELCTAASLGFSSDIPETGSSFEENSRLKASAIVNAFHLPSIADDSGLCVDALNGAPGIYSARFGGTACLSDRDRYELLLEKMKGIPFSGRGAAFVCVITVLYPDGACIFARGECRGVIAEAPAGKNGFGYDPIFIPDGYSESLAQLDPRVKNRISHRALAVQKLKVLLDKETKHA